ncbi:MAG TPA: secretin N-terminal domain-containing protein, partial [Vicinamibacterales bacterium]|nr:secretin N-terminal domain-containing protein [Vicinamibacterales bacterium]
MMAQDTVWKRLAAALAIALVVSGCAAGKAFRRGETAMRAGDLDAAVAAYRKAVQEAPDNATYKIALQRAMLSASRAHMDRAREYEQNDQLEAALGEYKLASEYDPTNRLASSKVLDLERVIRERAEAARPRPQIEQLRENARRASQPPPLLNFTTRMPRISFTNTSLREILTFVGQATGISVTFDRQYQDRNYTVQLDGVTLEQALNQILSVNSLSYKVLSERSILIFDDNAQKHQQYDDQVIQTFYLSNADATELAQILSQAFRPPGIAIQPAIAPNKAQNSITIRGTAPVVQIFEKLIQQNDKPRSEIVVDVEIMEVSRARVKQYGLNLSEYAIGGIFSPEVSPNGATTTTTTPGTGGVAQPGSVANTVSAGRGPSQITPPPPFNLNTITRGINTADFYAAVPTAIVKFLESDTNTKLVAKPQLRGAEGTKLTFKVGDQIPVISTSYLPVATGGAGQNPLSSYNYKDVGVTVEMTPRVTLENEILLDINVINNSRSADVVIGGINIPSFGNREVNVRLRLRDGESNLLAGLLREDERKSLTGFPGAIHVPVLKQLFSSNDEAVTQTDIVMLLTPHIVRGPNITEQDLKPIYIGSQQTFGVGGSPPLLAPPPEPAGPPPVPTASPTPALGQQTPQGTITVPPGASPVPGTVVVPNPPPPAPTVTPVAPPPQAAAPPPAAVQPQPIPVQPPRDVAVAPDAAPAISSPGLGGAQVVISPPAATLRVGQGPYNIPLSVTGAQRLSMVTLTLTFDPRILRVRAVQEGSFLRSGGANVTFTQQVNGGRIDIIISRASDATGVSGTGVLSAILFDAIAPGNVTLTASGTATGPGNTPMALQFRPVQLIVQ